MPFGRHKRFRLNTQKPMKKFFLFLFTVVATNCFAATGDASDGELALLLIITLFLLPVAVAYLLGFIKTQIKLLKTRRQLKKHDVEHHFTV